MTGAAGELKDMAGNDDPVDKAAGTVTRLIADLKEGDEAAAADLWALYFGRLIGLARARLGRSARAVADEEDVALSAFRSLCMGAAAGRFDLLRDRADLWKLLVVLTARKAIDQVRWEGRARRGGGRVVAEADLGDGSSETPPSIDQIVRTEPTPEFAALLAEEYRRRLDSLGDDTLRRVAELRMDGYSNDEIAASLGVVPRTVVRKVNMIRDAWIVARDSPQGTAA